MAASAGARPSIFWPLAAYAFLSLLGRVTGRTSGNVARPLVGRPAAVVRQAAPASIPKPQAEREVSVAPGWWSLFATAGSQWVAHKDARLGAALAYYSVFSLGPLIVIAVAVAGLIFGQD